MSIKRIVTLSFLLTIAIILNLLESLLPSLMIPGIKLGLANIIIIVTIFLFSFKEAFLVMFLRVILVGILKGDLLQISFFMSLLGALFSFFVMVLLKKIKVFSIIGVSISGSVAHIIGQIVVAIIALDTVGLLALLPYMLLLSIPTGSITGFLAIRILKLDIIKRVSQ